MHGEGATVRIEDALISGSGYSPSHGKDKGLDIGLSPLFLM